MTSKALEAAIDAVMDSEGYITKDDVIAIIRAYAENITDELIAECHPISNECKILEIVKAAILKGLEP